MSTQDELVFVKSEIIVLQAKDLLLNEMGVGEKKFFEVEDSCDIMMIERTGTDDPDEFILTPLWEKDDNTYSTAYDEDTPSAGTIVSEMNKEVFLNWINSPYSENADEFEVEDSEKPFTAAHLFALISDSNYIHSNEGTGVVEYKF